MNAFVGALVRGRTKTYAAWKPTVNRSALLELAGYTDDERAIPALARATQDTVGGPKSFCEKHLSVFAGR